MGLFWNKANTSIKWKIQVFNSIVRSKLLYSLECIQLIASEISKLNGFQNKMLRKILGKPSTFVDREETNSEMYEEIQRDHHCKFEHFGDTWKRTKLRLFGHILRSSPADPLNQLLFSPGKLVPRPVIKRRAGRSRSDWLFETYTDAFQFLYGPHAVFDIENNNHFQDVRNAALQRLPPFS